MTAVVVVITASVSSVTACVYACIQEEKHKKSERRNGVKEKSGLLSHADDSDYDIGNNEQEKYKLLN